MNSLLVIVLVTLGVAASHPLLNTNGFNFKRLYKPSIGSLQGAPVDGRVLNGTEAVPHSRPYEVYMIVEEDENYGWTCGGGLISKNYVLTAGHCVYYAMRATVILGAHDLSTAENTTAIYTATEFFLHDDFDYLSILFDIGLVKLSQSVTFTTAIQPIALPSKSDANISYVGETVTISGWGLTDGNALNISNVLMEVDVQVISPATCKTFLTGVEDYQICTAGDDNKGACNGDSGSPLIHNNVAIGLVSYGTIGCKLGFPTAFTNTGYFLDWILENSDVTSS